MECDSAFRVDSGEKNGVTIARTDGYPLRGWYGRPVRTASGDLVYGRDWFLPLFSVTPFSVKLRVGKE